MQLLVSTSKRLYAALITIVLACYVPVAVGATHAFDEWLNRIKQEAIEQGISSSTANKATRHIKFLPKVIALDRAQPEFINTFLAYYKSHVTAGRVKEGRKLLGRYKTLLMRLERKYGVPKEYLVAFWGLETNYGKNQGYIDTLSALATLAYEGRRAAFFKDQLFDAMRIIDHHDVKLRHLKGSWAGAFGHMQFMPSTFTKYAVDGDGNQKIDLTHSIPDALYSAANYLSQVGWDMSMPSVVEVVLPENFPYEIAHLKHQRTVSEWGAMGVKIVEAKVSDATYAQMHSNNTGTREIRKREASDIIPGLKESAVKVRPIKSIVTDASIKSSILLPQGWRGPAFMVFQNMYTVLDWNRSVNYALSVGLLAKQLDEKVTLARGANAEKGGLTRLKTLDLQKMLNSLGFDAGNADGYPGLKTQSAIRAYQLTQALPADGYASPSLYTHLQTNTLLSMQ